MTKLTNNTSNSDEKTMVYTGGFSGIQHARNFASKHGSSGGYNSKEKTSATWTPSGTGKRAKVTIVKTDVAYKHILKQFNDHQRELKSLKPLLGGSSGSSGGGEGPPTKKARKNETEVTISSEDED